MEHLCRNQLKDGKGGRLPEEHIGDKAGRCGTSAEEVYLLREGTVHHQGLSSSGRYPPFRIN